MAKHKPNHRRKTVASKPASHANPTKHDRMVRRNVTFTSKHAALLDHERERSGVPTATLLRQLIEQHFSKTGGSKA